MFCHFSNTFLSFGYISCKTFPLFPLYLYSNTATSFLDTYYSNFYGNA